MTDIWGWSHNDEEATGDDEAGSTREEAIAAAIETGDFGPGDVFYTFRRKVGIDESVISVNVEWVLDELSDSVFQEIGDRAVDRIDAIPANARGVLEVKLTEVLREWLADNGVDFSHWWAMEDCESYTVPEKDEP